MRILQLNKSLKFLDDSNNEITLKENIDYIVPEIFLIKINSFGFSKHIVKDDEFKYEERKYKGQDLKRKSVIVFRNGGIGDLMFFFPAVAELKRKYKNSKVVVCCSNKYSDLFLGNDDFDKVIHLPLELEELLKYDYYIQLQGIIEDNKDAETRNAYDLHNERFYVQPDEDNMIPKLFPQKEEINKVEKYIEKDKKNIVIAYAASVPIRSVNPDLYINLIQSLNKQYKDKFNFIIVCTPSQENEAKKILNICDNLTTKIFTGREHKLRELIALVSLSNCVISPDSGLIHIGAAFKKPLIGIYGPFSSMLRMKYYRNAIGLDSKTNCIMGRGEMNCCFQHGEGSCKIARKRAEIYSPCMTLYNIEELIFSLKNLKIIEDEIQ